MDISMNIGLAILLLILAGSATSLIIGIVKKNKWLIGLGIVLAVIDIFLVSFGTITSVTTTMIN